VNQPTWKELVRDALIELGGEGHLSEINRIIEGHEKTKTNPTWKATIRRVVRQYRIFEPVGEERSGRYRLVDEKEIELKEHHLNEQAELNHGAVQGMLLSIGRILNYETFCPKTDQSTRSFLDRKLDEFVTVRDFGDKIWEKEIPFLREIDVLWLSDDGTGIYPKYAFEVEHTTRVKSGLERLLQIPQRYQTRLYAVVPSEKEAKLFERYTERVVFRRYKSRFSLKLYEQVEKTYNYSVQYEKMLNEMDFKYNQPDW